MKLIHYTIGRLSLVLLLTMAFWTLFFYFQLLNEVRDETDDSLRNYKKIIIKQALRDSSLLTSHVDILTRYYIHEIPEEAGKQYEERFVTTEAFNEYEMDEEPVRVLYTSFRTDNGRYYELTILTSTLEEDDMLESILWSIIYLYIAMLICILVVTQLVFRKSLRPLYKLIHWLDSYTLGKKNNPLENKTKVSEFKRLNRTISEMAMRNEKVFGQQKQFLENASHELQTPLAICSNKLELLSENPCCTEELLDEIGEIHQTIGCIIKLNKSLLLLSRIENRQYGDEKDVNFNALISRINTDFNLIYAPKELSVEIKEEGIFSFRMNETLSQVLLTNLLKNALIHSPNKGIIQISIRENEIVFSNTATDAPLNTEKIFLRFYHASDKKTESTGLGLAIVKSIVDSYDLQIHYFYDGKHHFSLKKIR